jgi:hypothetical protein
MMLHLGEIEVRSTTPFDELFSVVEKVKTEIEHGTGHGLTVYFDPRLV